MLKKLLPLLIIPCLLFASEIKEDYFFTKPVISKGAAIIRGCRLSKEAFAPLVSVRPVRLLVPKGEMPVSFDVEYGDPITLAGSYYLKPVTQGGRISFMPPNDYLKRSSPVYERDEFHPGSVKSENFYTIKKNGHIIFITVLNPIQYNPVSGVLQYFNKIAVKVNTVVTRDLPVYKCNSFIKSQLKNLVDNPEAVDALPNSERNPGDYEYLIVASDAIQNNYGAFVEFNTRRAMRTKVTSMSDIKSNMSGDDDADKVRNYIIQEYENHNIVYVLLGGDDDNSNSNDVPHRGMHASFYDYGSDYYDDKDVAADCYFSCLDGDWKGSNQYYGEFGTEDIGWEVYASRFPADNASELTNLMDKTIKYMETPVVNETKNALLAGEYAWGPPDHPVECWGKDEMLLLKGTCTQNGYTTEGLPSSWDITELYDKDNTWTKTTLTNAIKNDKICWLNHVGHSNNTYIMKLYNNDVNTSNFTNNGTNANFFFASTTGCYNGSFDNKTPGGSYTSDCIAEQFTVGIPTAAIIFLSCTRYGLGDDGTASADGTDGSSVRYQRYFHDAIFNKKLHHAEMMNGYSKEINADLIIESDITKPPYYGQMKYMCYEWTILGDPALSMWTEIPQNLQADHPTTLSSTTFTWDTQKPYTWVALLDGNGRADTIICAQLTGEDGKCNINDQALASFVNANPGGKLKINVKAHNYLPYQGEIQISSQGISEDLIDKAGSRITINGKYGRIAYSLPVKGLVTISLYDSRGALIKTVLNENQNAGDHSVGFNSSDISNGIYYLRMGINNNKLVKKFVVTK